MYRITPEEYDAMYDQQKGCCAICGAAKEPWEPGVGIAGRGRFLVVDHSHETSSVRGLLCLHCNCGIGQLRDSVPILLAAITYLST